MPSIKTIGKQALAVFILVASVGCGADRGTEPVTGTVTMGGSPLADATITFVPEGEGNGAAGTTDASGNFTLTTFEASDGALPGNYKVTVTKFEGGAAVPNTAEMSEEEIYAQMEAAGQDVMGGDEGFGQAKSLVPTKYGNATTTDLTATVAEGENTFTFDLTP